MYASFEAFERSKSRTAVVPPWFLRIVAPALIILALPLAVVVMAVMLGLSAAAAILDALRRRPVTPDAGAGGGVLTDVDYVIIDERPAEDSRRPR